LIIDNLKFDILKRKIINSKLTIENFKGLTMKKIFVWLLLLVICGWLSASYTITEQTQWSKHAVKKIAFSITGEQSAETETTSETFIGTLLRVGIPSGSGDNAWQVTLSSDSVDMWTSGDINTTTDFSKPVTTTDGTNYFAGCPLYGTLTLTTANNVGTAEVQTISTPNEPNGGTFTLTFDSETTVALPWDVNQDYLDANIEALSTIGVNNVTTSLASDFNSTVDIVFTFAGTLASTDVSLLTIDTTSLTEAGVAVSATVTETTAGVPAAGTVYIYYKEEKD